MVIDKSMHKIQTWIVGISGIMRRTMIFYALNGKIAKFPTKKKFTDARHQLGNEYNFNKKAICTLY